MISKRMRTKLLKVEIIFHDHISWTNFERPKKVENSLQIKIISNYIIVTESKVTIRYVIGFRISFGWGELYLINERRSLG